MLPTWVLIALIAYIVIAFAQLVDKAMLNVAMKEAKSYVFLTGSMNLLVLVLLPFGVTMLDFNILLISLFGGALFIVALIPFLSALQGDDASRIIPLVGGLIPLFIFTGEILFLNASFSKITLLAFALLVTGSIVLTISHSTSARRSWLSVFKAILGSLLFAASFVITKYVFDNIGFINGFFWMRIGGVLVAIALFMRKDVRRGLKQFFKHNPLSLRIGYFANQGLNGFGFVLQNYAISLASVSLVTALQGVQYLFVILFIVIASKFKPGLIGEKITKGILVEKLAAVAIIITGIALLALS